MILEVFFALLSFYKTIVNNSDSNLYRFIISIKDISYIRQQ